MTTSTPGKELVVLTADKNCQFTLRGLLARSKSLGIRRITADYRIHPQHDPGVLRSAHEFLRSFARTHAHALVIMDREGSGREQLGRLEMEQTIESALNKAGWADRGAAVVIDPELDVWVWTNSPHVPTELGWANRQPDLWTWLRQRGFLKENMMKPERPKEALEAVLREVREPRSSALYGALAEKVGLTKCTDPAFGKLKAILRGWFVET